MPQKQQRHSLKAKQAKLILDEVSKRLNRNIEDIIGEKAKFEIAETDLGDIYFVNGRPLLYGIGGETLPTLFFTELYDWLPKIVVDMGAVPYVCKGADIMAPGIVRIEGEFSRGDLVLVLDVKHGKMLVLGEALYDGESAKKVKKGAVVKSLHFVSDKIWETAKTLA
jgi:PUA domain protein